MIPLFKSDVLPKLEKVLESEEWTFELFKYNGEWFANLHPTIGKLNQSVGSHSTKDALSAITRLLSQRG